MAFDFTTAAAFKPKVAGTLMNSGGGGGNTGYFQQERKKKKDDSSIMTKMDEDDFLNKTLNAKLPELEDDSGGLIGKIKGFFGK